MTNGTYNGAGSGTTKVLWHMEGNSNDSSGNANNGTDTGMSYGLAYGKFGQGGLANGTTSKIVKATNLGIAGTGALTVCVWIKPTAEIAAAQWVLWSFRSTLTADRFIQLLYAYNGGTRQIQINAGGTASTYNITLGNTIYRNLIVTRTSGGNVIGYLDGNQVIPSFSQGATGVAANYFSLFSDNAATYCPASGDECIVENTDWSAAAVRKYYTFAKGRFGL
jgi:hypothetical protein